jgi:predicted outer membrane lipoprotein
VDLTQVTPPDDTGSSTFRRYRYQVHVAFPYLLACAIGQGITAVLLEHIEDLAVEVDGVWHLKQIKTRDGHRGPWKVSDVLASGGIDSLFRSYRAISPLVPSALYELLLEGSLERTDDMKALCGMAPISEELRSRIQSRLESRFEDCTDEDVERFFDGFNVIAIVDTRDTIENRNRRLVMEAGPQLSGTQQKAVYQEIMEMAERAMASEGVDALAEAILAEAALGKRKALREADLQAVASSLRSGASSLLSAVVSEDRDLTQLVQKMLMGGASSTIVENAKQLRAQASYWEQAQMASGNLEDDVFEDLRLRLEVIANSAVAQCADAMSPADMVWERLLQQLLATPGTVDRRSSFDRDPMLLLGEVCEMSDQCRVGWGVAHA